MKGGTLFSGIGAPECAMPAIDWHWAAEIDPFACAVHKARFPGVSNLGDVTRISADAIEPVDLVVFGSPCQSFSVAGKRLGLDDPRGNLALVALGLIGQLRPGWVVFENVPGLLSSDEGRDFSAFLGLLGKLGYGFAYRILDAQYFGVPQRRRRVFVVGHLGDWRAAAAVLFEPESLRGDTAPRRETGQRVADGIAPCLDAGEWRGPNRNQIGVAIPTADNLIAFSAKDHGADAGDIAPTLRAGTHHRSHANAGVMPAICGTVGAENVRHTTGMESGADLLVTHTLRADGFDASEDGTGRGTPLIPITFDHQVGGSERTYIHDKPGRARALTANKTLAALAGMSVRRLTPVECERLQGFPDDYTLVPYRGKPAADGPRYRAIGNSMAVPVIGWILGRVRAVEIINNLAAIRLANSAVTS